MEPSANQIFARFREVGGTQYCGGVGGGKVTHNRSEILISRLRRETPRPIKKACSLGSG
jgi:hypothetical protein